MLEDWPTSAEVHAAVAERVHRLLDEFGGLVAEVGRRALSVDSRVLGEHPHSISAVLVPGTCFSAGGDWRTALWPAVGAECVMAAADLFDDVADADPGAGSDSPGVLLTCAAGLLSLATVAVTRVVEDGASIETALVLGQLVGVEFTRAANGQASNLNADPHLDTLGAFRQAQAKSGPFGSLMARLGARTATDDAQIVDLLGNFGWHLTVHHQLLNDARDAAPGAARTKADVLVGARTVPLVFSGSRGAPPGMNHAALEVWEAQERIRIAAGGGLSAALALAEAERLEALRALDTLVGLGRSVGGLRALIE